MAELQRILFKEFVTLQRGFDLPTKQRDGGPYPVVASTAIHGNHKEYKVTPPGVTTGRSGALGEVLYLEQPFWPLNTTLWVKDFKGNVPRYVYYFLKTMDLKRWDAGTGVPTLNRNHLNNVEIAVHSPKNQKKIAAILSAYDELIENNTRRIQILEEMAQTIYHEWFVKFRFSGHESVKMVESELGLIPEGWEKKRLTDMCSRVIDGTHDTPKPVKEGYYLVTGKHIVDGFIDFSKCYLISPEEHKKVMNRSRPEKGDIIFSNIGTLGSTVPVDQDFEFSIKNVALFKPLKTLYSAFLYLYFSIPQTLERMIRKAGGTSQKFFSLEYLRSLELIVPPDAIILKFDYTIGSFLELRSVLNERNQKLREARDLLLPKLISGELDVENLDINTEGLTNG